MGHRFLSEVKFVRPFVKLATFTRRRRPYGQTPLLALPSQSTSANFCTWNGAAVFQNDEVKAAKKIEKINLLSEKAHVICLQEAHGTVADLRVRAPQVAALYHCFFRSRS